MKNNCTTECALIENKMADTNTNSYVSLSAYSGEEIVLLTYSDDCRIRVNI